jgi:hypothetical protein
MSPPPLHPSPPTAHPLPVHISFSPLFPLLRFVQRWRRWRADSNRCFHASIQIATAPIGAYLLPPLILVLMSLNTSLTLAVGIACGGWGRGACKAEVALSQWLVEPFLITVNCWALWNWMPLYWTLQHYESLIVSNFASYNGIPVMCKVQLIYACFSLINLVYVSRSDKAGKMRAYVLLEGLQGSKFLRPQSTFFSKPILLLPCGYFRAAKITIPDLSLWLGFRWESMLFACRS